jgi:hypothetical protein
MNVGGATEGNNKQESAPGRNGWSMRRQVRGRKDGAVSLVAVGRHGSSPNPGQAMREMLSNPVTLIAGGLSSYRYGIGGLEVHACIVSARVSVSRVYVLSARKGCFK